MDPLDIHNDFHGFDREVRLDNSSDAISLLEERSHELKDMKLYDEFSSRSFYLYYPPADNKTDDDFISFCERFGTMDNYRKTFETKSLFNSYLMNYRVADVIFDNRSNIYNYSDDMKYSWLKLVSDFFGTSNKVNQLNRSDPNSFKRSAEIFKMIKLNEFAEHGKPDDNFIDFLEREAAHINDMCSRFSYVNYSKASEFILAMDRFSSSILTKTNLDKEIIEAYYSLSKEDIPYFIQNTNSELSITSTDKNLFLANKLLWLKFKIRSLKIAKSKEIDFRIFLIQESFNDDSIKEYKHDELISLKKDFTLETRILLRNIYDESALNELNCKKQKLFYDGLSKLSNSDQGIEIIKFYADETTRKIDYNFLVELLIEAGTLNEVLNIKSFVDYDCEGWCSTPISWHLAQMT